MKHAHVAALETLYKHFSSQDADAIFAHCADGATFQVEGKSPLAGKYTRDTLPGYFAKQLEVAGGDYKFAVHDVMGSDQHAVVLCSETLGKGDKAKVLRQAHVWRFQDGKPLAGYVYARDLYAYDGAWA